MADSIKINIDIVTKETLQEIKKFSANAAASLSKINKEISYQNELTEKQVKNIRVLSSSQKTFAAAAGVVSGALIVQNQRVAEITVAILGLGEDILKTTKVSGFLGKSFNSAARTTGVLAKAVLLFDKGVIGLALNLSTVSVALFGLGKATDLVNNEFVQFTGSALKLSSVITGALAVGLIALIEGVSRLSINIGTKLVDSTQKAIGSFIEFEKKTFVFNRTIEGYNKAFGDSIGTTETWTKTVKDVSNATGFTEKALRGAVTEIIATTSAMGFNEAQQKKLLDITTDYASFLGGNVVQTTIEFISALNGQAQSVQKYGVKLGAANLQQKIYAEGLALSFSQLSESEKTQKRWASLLKQYAPIAGNAAAVTKTLAGQQKLLENNLTNLEQAYGRGAAVIENNTLAAAALNTVVSNVNETVVESVGFFTTLGGRMLQIAGYVIKLTFNFLALYKIINLINFVLGTKFLTNIINFPFPVFNKSLGGLLRNLGITYLSFNSLGDIAKTVGTIFLDQAKITAKAFLGSEGAINSFGKLVMNVFKGISLAAGVVTKSFLAFLANPIVLGIAAISAALFGLYKALAFIEERTGFFKAIGEVLKEVFIDSAKSVIDFIAKIFKSIRGLINVVLDFIGSIEIIAPIIRKIKKVINSFFDSLESLGKSFIKFLSNFRKGLQTLLKKTIGLLIAGLSKILEISAKLIAKDPFGIFSKEQIEKINSAGARVRALGDEIEELSFDFTGLKSSASRSVASVNDKIKKIDIAPLVKLQEELGKVGLTDLQKLENQKNERLKIIEAGLKSEGESYKLAVKLREKIELDFNEQLGEIRKKEADEEKAQAEKRLKFIEDYKKSFIDTGKQITSILGKVGQSASQAFRFAFGGEKQSILDEIGLNESKLEENFKAGIITEVQFDLEKESLDKQRDDLERNTYIGITAGIANSIASGAKGAEDLVVGAIQTGLDMLVPGLGEALGPILRVFAQGPEATKKFVKEFMDSLPVLIENIILSLPAMIEAIGDNLDKLLLRLIEMTPELVYKLVLGSIKAVIAVISGVARYFRDIIKAAWREVVKGAVTFLANFVVDFAKSLLRGIGKALSSLGGSLFKDLGKLIFQGFIAALTGGFNILGSLFKKIFGFDGGGRGPVEKFLGFDFPFIKFSSGGLVGGSAKTRGDSPLNDTIPALLSAGEVVVPRSAVSGGAGGIIDFLMGMGIMPKGFFLGGLIEDFVSTLAGGLGSLIGGGVGFVSDLFDPFGGLVEQAENYLTRFTEYTLNPKKWIDILKSLSRIGAEIDLDDLFDNPLDVISNAVKGVLDFFQGSFKNLLKANSPFAQGGMVPAGFNNDTFNARLTSGEYVIDRGLTGRLNDYLEAQAPQTVSNNMSVEILSKILSTMQKGQTINTNVEFNGDSLANIILELNRSNARLA
jgi:hypothetical protein